MLVTSKLASSAAWSCWQVVDGLRGLRGAGVEPREVRQQQARIEAPPLAHRLAPEPDRLGGAVERAGGKHLLGRLARMEQRSVPRRGKGRIAATADIGRLRRHPRHLRRRAHLPMAAEVFEKLRDANGSELVGVEECGSAVAYPPSRRREGLGGGPATVA